MSELFERRRARKVRALIWAYSSQLYAKLLFNIFVIDKY